MTEVPRHWRLEKIRYGLVGNQCPHCETLMFPPREICINCGQPIKNMSGEIYSSLKTSLPTEVSKSSK
jgi:hypothetical protein